MYGMPQPTNYGQYGFGAYGGFPNQAAAAGTPGAAAPGMASPVAATAAMGLGAPQSPADPTAAAQAAQGQWAGADPSSYYSNYWGGELRLHVQIMPLVDACSTGYYGQQAPGAGAPDGQGQA